MYSHIDGKHDAVIPGKEGLGFQKILNYNGVIGQLLAIRRPTTTQTYKTQGIAPSNGKGIHISGVYIQRSHLLHIMYIVCRGAVNSELHNMVAPLLKSSTSIIMN